MKQQKNILTRLYHIAIFLIVLTIFFIYKGWWFMSFGTFLIAILTVFQKVNKSPDDTYVAPDISKMDPREVFERLKRNAQEEDRQNPNSPLNDPSLNLKDEPLVDYTKYIKEYTDKEEAMAAKRAADGVSDDLKPLK